jgi:hypothetical protein
MRKFDLKFWKRSIKFLWQRLTRGWDDSITWNLDARLAEHIVPRLKRFKEVNIAYPMDLSWEEWQIVLDKMIFALEWLSTDCVERDESANTYDRVIEGTNLFGKYLPHLWW